MGHRKKVADDEVAMRNLANLKHLRTSKNLQQKELADLLGCGATTISHAEVHPDTVTVTFYNMLAGFFGWERYQSSRGAPFQLPKDESPQLTFDDCTFDETKQPEASDTGCSVRIPPDVFRKLTAIAELHGCEVGSLLCELVNLYTSRIKELKF